MATKKKVEAPSYLDEFYALNGRKGYEFLEDQEYTGKRDEDRETVRTALRENARSGSASLAQAAQSPEHGTITVEDVMGTNQS